MGVVAGGRPNYGKNFDVEQLLRDLEILFKEELNPLIDALNTSKGANPIKNIPDDAWFLNHIGNVHDFPIFITWGVSDLSDEESNQIASIQSLKLFLEVVIPDSGEDDTNAIIYQLFRYIRVFKQLVNEKLEERFQGIINEFNVDDSLPASFSVDDANKLKAAGIVIEFKFTTN